MLVLYKRVHQGEITFHLVSDNQWKYTISNYIRLQDITYKLVKFAEIEETDLPKIVGVLTKKLAKVELAKVGRVATHPLMEF